jgi:hypothetical protein
MKQSILQSDMSKCYVCGATQNLHLHHIYEGTANRKKSDKYRCYVMLCGMHHNLSKFGVHYNKTLDICLKKKCQKEFERIYSHDKFMEVFKRNYL